MQDTLSVSEQGLRLIKAFEGFRPVDRKLVSGARVVGHGHRVRGEGAVRLDTDSAHEVLLDDLAPFEDMINENVYASISQAQFDALASLAYNIGPKAFLESDVLGAVNAGRPLEAASAFDAWRMADVGGRTFVVDALVRRRTAEKALFLRPGADALAPKAPRVDLDVVPDARVVVDHGELDVLDRDAAGRLVADAPYEIERLITDMPSRRRDDMQVGDLAWSELEPQEPVGDRGEDELEAGIPFGEDLDANGPDANVSDANVSDGEALDGKVSGGVEGDGNGALDAPSGIPARSAIADAADEVRDRLAALMEGGVEAPEDPTNTWPESLIRPAQSALALTAEADSKVVAFPTDSVARRAPGPESSSPGDANPGERAGETVAVIRDDLPTLELTERLRNEGQGEGAAQTPAAQTPAAPAAPDWVYDGEVAQKGESAAPYVALMILGGGLLGAGATALWRGVERIGGVPGELAGLGAALLGALILSGGLGYLIKQATTQGRTR